jgi:hypothetical protein
LEAVKDTIMDLPTRDDTDELFEKVNTDLLEFKTDNDDFRENIG